MDWYRPMFSLKCTTPPPTEGDPLDRDLDPPMSWEEVIAGLTVALQPVISLRGGRVIGYEALTRLPEGLGVTAPMALFDAAARADLERAEEESSTEEVSTQLAALERRAWTLALEMFHRVEGHRETRLFLNLDSRLLVHWTEMASHLTAELARLSVDRTLICLEINEHLPLGPWWEAGTGEGREGGEEPIAALEAMGRVVESLRRTVGRISLDDFGAGNASLPLLHALQPDYVKLDRFFADGVASDQVKKLFMANLVNICHLLGIQTVAKGVENAPDYYACREAGVDLVQGCLLACPEGDVAHVRVDFPEARALNALEQRSGQGDEHLVAAQTLEIEPITRASSMTDVFDRFRRHKDQTFFPVVDENREPLGIVRELDLKDYTYSPFGKDLINNKGLGRNLEAFITRCPTVDIATRAEKILEIFSSNAQSEGLIITEDGRYRGFLTTPSLLRVINEKNLVAARDQNPLSKLPGNTVINEYLADTLSRPDEWLSLAYIDFDFFKPFNDKYGFRQGDRAILLFAELMRAQLGSEGHFIGHVGGDDFFTGLRGVEPEDVVERVRALVRRFEQDVASFYDEETRRRGYIVAKDREGVDRRMPLLSASSAIVQVPPGHPPLDIDAISNLIARLKKDAKRAEGKIAAAVIGQTEEPLE